MLRIALRLPRAASVPALPFVCRRCTIDLRHAGSTSVRTMASKQATEEAGAEASEELKQAKPTGTQKAASKETTKEVKKARAAVAEKREKKSAAKPKAKKKKKKVLTGGVSLANAMKGEKPLPKGTVIEVLDADSTTIQPVPMDGQPEVKRLNHGLDRLLFNPGVVYLRDPRTGVYNFDPYLQTIMPVTEFDFNAVSSYVTSSKDTKLEALAKGLNRKYIGSTSSMTSVLSHIHFLLSAWQPINMELLSKGFPADLTSFSGITKMPVSIFLRYKGDGTYAIDSDNEFDADNILNLLGVSMEKSFTLSPEDFEKYRKGNSHNIAPEDRNKPETYNYSVLGDFLLRSQIDAHDPRLPGTGMFDLKTRAVAAVRMDVSNFHLGSGYQLKDVRGKWESFEREYYEMTRSAFLKYSLQVRIGRMDGIFVAFHNTERIFGFQYITLDEMDTALHGGSGVGRKEFVLNLQLLNRLLNRAVERFPNQSLRIFFETREAQTPFMYMGAQPISEEKIEEIQLGDKVDLETFLRSLKEKRDSITKGPQQKPATVEQELAHLEGVMGEVAKKGEDAAADHPAEQPVNDVATDKTEESETPGSAATEEGTAAEKDEAEEGRSIEEVMLEGEEEEDEDEEDEEGKENEEEDEEDEEDKEDGEDEDKAVEKEKEDGVSEDGVSEDGVSEDGASVVPADGTPAVQPDDVLCLKVTIESYVNGKPTLRPTTLEPSDNWKVHCNIKELKSNRARATYEAMKERKRKFLTVRRSTDDDEISDYLKWLRELSARGREWQNEQEMLYEGKKVVLGQGQ